MSLVARCMPFGSRVQGNAKPFSDLDLAVMGEAPLDFRQLCAFKDAFSESNLPFELMCWIGSVTSKAFQGIIEAAYEVVELGSCGDFRKGCGNY